MNNQEEMRKVLLVKHGFTAPQIIEEGRVKQEDIDAIKEWVNNEKIPKLTEEQIVMFLLSCANDQKDTKATIKSFYYVRKHAPELFDNRNIEREELKKQLNTGRFCVLPRRTDDGHVIVFCKFHDTYYYNFDMGPFLALVFMTLDAALYDHPPNGLIFLYDMRGMGLMHLTRLRFGFIKWYFQYLQEGLPVKLKSIHLLNSVYFIDKLMRLIRPFARQEVLDVMYFHPSSLDMEIFYETCIPKKCLPEDYGGELPAIQELHEANIQRLAELQSYFDDEELQRHSIDT